MAAPRGLRGKDLERARVVDDVMAELETVALTVVEHLQAEMECYRALPVADVLRGWRIGTDVIWEYLALVGRKQGVGDDILLDLMRETSRAVDPAIVAFVTGHHRAELEWVRDEDHGRGELVQRVLRGLLVGSELREQCSVRGLDPDR